MQPPSDGGELVFEDLPNGKFKVYWDDWGKRALMMKYAVEGGKLKQISGQNNAAVNGWVMHLTPDGKRIMILGGGGWRPKGEGAGGGYVVAVYNADNLESMVGQAPHGINIAFHSVLNLGVTFHAGTDLSFFNARSLTTRGTLHFSKVGTGGQALLTFGGKGTKVLVWNGEDLGHGQGLQIIPLELSAEDRAALEKKYGKLVEK
jgi:hypothetical protein